MILAGAAGAFAEVEDALLSSPEVNDAAAGIACAPGRSASACVLDVTDFASVNCAL